MRKTTTLKVVASVVACFAVTTIAEAGDTVNLDVQTAGTLYTALGAASDVAGNTLWTSTSGFALNPPASDGTASPIDLSFGGANAFLTEAGRNDLQGDWVFASGDNLNATFNISGLNASLKYDVYLYVGASSVFNTATDFTIGGTTKTATGTSITTPNGGPFTEGDEYVVFTGLTGSTSIFGGYVSSAGLFGSGTFAGIQISQVDSDFDVDGDVDGNDFLIWQRGFGVGSTLAEGDANMSGTVDDVDLGIWEIQHGHVAPLGAVAAVPEPNTAVMLVLGFLALASAKSCH